VKTLQRDFKTLVAEYERRLIEEALAASGGNQRRAAAALKTLPTTLHEKMKRLGLIPSGAPPADDGPASEREG
jgi:DNA-binding NtrC family response regulator